MSTGLAKVAVEGESAGAESLSYYQTIIAIAVIIIAVIPNAIIIFGWLSVSSNLFLVQMQEQNHLKERVEGCNQELADLIPPSNYFG